MFIYHFCFDLNYYKFIQTDFYNNPLWINFRIVIVSLFLWVMGVSLWLATEKGIKPPRYFKRLMLLALAAAAVSLASYISFPNSVIFFGILHFILAASIAGLLFIRLYYPNLLIGLSLIVIGSYYNNEIFNHPNLQWFGLMTHKPITEDYVPFLPWFGVVLLGLFSAQFIFKYRHLKLISRWREKSTSQKLICCMGRHSLLIYLVHQPLFLGILFIFKLMLS